MQWQGAVYIQGIGGRSRISGLALTAGVRSGVGVLVDYGRPTTKSSTSGTVSTRLAARPATIKTQHQRARLALRLDAEEASWWWRLGFEDDSQDQRGAEQISQIDDAADCAGSLDLTCMKCDKRVSVAKHLHNLSPFSLHSMIEVSAEAWHATLYLITPWQYLPRLGMLFYILSRLGSISRGYILSRLGSIRRGLAFYSISYHALEVSATPRWHAIAAILYLEL